MGDSTEKERQAAAERQRQKRERDKRLDMKNFTMRLARGERALIDKMAEARGYEDRTEYLFSRVVADSKSLDCDMSQQVARAIHYPECWDVAAYPSMEAALVEVAAWFKCSACG